MPSLIGSMVPSCVVASSLLVRWKAASRDVSPGQRRSRAKADGVAHPGSAASLQGPLPAPDTLIYVSPRFHHAAPPWFATNQSQTSLSLRARGGSHWSLRFT
eukprot:3077582-Rhodomonas_salina.5